MTVGKIADKYKYEISVKPKSYLKIEVFPIINNDNDMDGRYGKYKNRVVERD